MLASLEKNRDTGPARNRKPLASLTLSVGPQEDDPHARIRQPDDLLLDGVQIDLLVVRHGGDQGRVDAIIERALGVVETVGSGGGHFR